MSNLPKGWELKYIEDIAEVKGGKRLPKGSSLSENITPYPYIRVTNMYMGGIDFSDILYVPEDIQPQIKNYTISKNDLFISVAGTLGIVGEVPEELDNANLTENADKLTNIKINKKFLLYVLMSNLIQNEIKNQTTSNAQPKLALSRIKQLQISVPPIEEQKKIADILSTVDKKIAFVEENINATEELKKGLMQKLLTEGIGHTEFKETKIGKVPFSWEVLKLVESISLMTDYVANGSFASLAENVNVYDEPNYAVYVRLFDLRKGLGHEAQKYVDEDSYKFLSKSSLVGNEILIANIGANVGEAFLMPNIDKPATLAPNMIEIKVDIEKLISEFLYFYLTSNTGLSELEKVTEGSGQPKINKTKLKTINVPIPPLKEQLQIIEILSTVDNKLENLKEKKQYFEELKKGLMQKLLTGEVRV